MYFVCLESLSLLLCLSLSSLTVSFTRVTCFQLCISFQSSPIASLNSTCQPIGSLGGTNFSRIIRSHRTHRHHEWIFGPIARGSGFQSTSRILLHPPQLFPDEAYSLTSWVFLFRSRVAAFYYVSTIKPARYKVKYYNNNRKKDVNPVNTVNVMSWRSAGTNASKDKR